MSQVITNLQIQSPNASTVTFDNTNFILQSLDGVDLPLIRLPRYNLPGQSGAFISNQLYGERVIKIKGIVNAPDGKVNTYLANRNSLINALSIVLDNTGALQPLTLQITLQNGLVLTSSVYISDQLSLGFPEDQIEWSEFLIQLVAPNPTFYSTISSSTNIFLPIGGGTAIPTVIPISLAPSSGGSAVINNTGTVLTYPTIIISAPITNPYIVNQRTGLYLKINKVLNVGDASLVINCANQTIFQGATNLTGIQTSDSSFWTLLSGNNTIAFSASAGSGTATIVFFPAYIGI